MSQIIVPSPISRRSPRSRTRSRAFERLFPDKLLLFLDLDETLILTSYVVGLSFPDDVPTSDFSFSLDESGIYHVRVRPKSLDFLRWASKKFEVCVFTASMQNYADPILDYLDPEGEMIHHRLYRQSCEIIRQGGSVFYVKDLRSLGVDLNSALLVDDSLANIYLNRGNGLPIAPWDGKDMEDTALLRTMMFLEVLLYLRDEALISDVREYVVKNMEDLSLKAD